MQEEKRYNRKEFIHSTGLAMAGLAAQSTIPAVLFAKPAVKKNYTVQEIIDMLITPVPGAPFANTVDTLKSGEPGQLVTGIVTTMFATVKVIRDAAEKGANFIIAHEPTFYNHADEKTWAGENHIVKQKEELLAKYHMAVWRFHDYQHSYRPDQVRQGVLEELGWENDFDSTEGVVNIFPSPLRELVSHVKNKLGIDHLRIVGNPNQRCKRIVIMPGAAGGQSQMRTIEQTRPDVFICGEVREWETAENIRDAVLFGEHTSMILLGHAASEEPGLKLLAKELAKKLDTINVTHIPSGSPFTWM